MAGTLVRHGQVVEGHKGGDLNVSGVAASSDDGVLSVGFDLGAGEQALILSCSPDGERCLVAEPGQRTAYDAVTSWSLDGRVVQLIISDKAAALLDIPRVVSLELADVDFASTALEAQLAQVIGTPPGIDEDGSA